MRSPVIKEKEGLAAFFSFLPEREAGIKLIVPVSALQPFDSSPGGQVLPPR